jgi:UDP-N-acetylglucosamine 4,6-dehydratase
LNNQPPTAWHIFCPYFIAKKLQYSECFIAIYGILYYLEIPLNYQEYSVTTSANPRPFDGKTILLTGGTGSFGKQFVRTVLANHQPKALRIYSRDELKQFEMQQVFVNPVLRYFIGDIRDRDRLQTAMSGVDIVVHAAAMKQVPACEYNPFEAVKTNVLGAQNVVETAINAGVQQVMCISTDKAVNPVNLYGATKLCAEKIFVHGNSYVGSGKTRFSVVRYGNVVGSRGSVVPLFLKQAPTGEITVTDTRMTRFWITLPAAVDFVIRCIDYMQGGEIFVPKLSSMKITDLATLLAPDCRIKSIGIRPGEKLHEILITEEDGRNCVELNGMYVILPARPDVTGWWKNANYTEGVKMPDGFIYSSDRNTRWLTGTELMEMIISNHDLESYTARLVRPGDGLAPSLRTSIDKRARFTGSLKRPKIRLDYAGTEK